MMQNLAVHSCISKIQALIDQVEFKHAKMYLNSVLYGQQQPTPSIAILINTKSTIGWPV